LPELPEVETVIRSITPKIIKQKIIGIKLNWDKTLYTHSESELNKSLKNKCISSVSRRGKYIIIHLQNRFLIIHLRMTGKLIFQKKNIKPLQHSRFEILFNDKSKLIFTDIRKFGRIGYHENLNFLNNKLGLEPFSKNLNTKYLYNKLKLRPGPIKGTLLNQSIIAGIGNIYADEILFKIKVHPQIPAKTLNSKKLSELILATQSILKNAIDSMGTTIINFSFDKNSSGKYGSQLKVFNKNNEKCQSCSNYIKKIKCAGRGTHFCPHCQKL
tara:strand:- start:4293 stop:5105 length:813 start_codon:yes stop_codon:yes gene_type:complete